MPSPNPPRVRRLKSFAASTQQALQTSDDTVIRGVVNEPLASWRGERQASVPSREERLREWGRDAITNYQEGRGTSFDLMGLLHAFVADRSGELPGERPLATPVGSLPNPLFSDHLLSLAHPVAYQSVAIVPLPSPF